MFARAPRGRRTSSRTPLHFKRSPAPSPQRRQVICRLVHVRSLSRSPHHLGRPRVPHATLSASRPSPDPAPQHRAHLLSLSACFVSELALPAAAFSTPAAAFLPASTIPLAFFSAAAVAFSAAAVASATILSAFSLAFAATPCSFSSAPLAFSTALSAFSSCFVSSLICFLRSLMMPLSSPFLPKLRKKVLSSSACSGHPGQVGGLRLLRFRADVGCPRFCSG